MVFFLHCLVSASAFERLDENNYRFNHEHSCTCKLIKLHHRTYLLLVKYSIFSYLLTYLRYDFGFTSEVTFWFHSEPNAKKTVRHFSSLLALLGEYSNLPLSVYTQNAHEKKQLIILFTFCKFMYTIFHSIFTIT